MLLMIGLAVIGTFAIIAVLIDPIEGYHTPYDPRNDLPIWAFLRRR